MLEAKDFADALNAAPDAILIVDSGGRIEFASERVSAIFGYAAGEIVDTCVDGLLPEPYRAAHAVQRATFAKVPVPRAMGSGLRLYGRHRDGSSVSVEISLAPLPTGNGTKVICSIRNAALHRNIEDQLRNRIEAGATRLQQSEAESRQQRELLRLFMTHMPGAAAMLDADLRYLAVTPSWLRDYGLGERDVLGKSHYEIFPEIPERWRAIHRRALAGESLSAIDDASTFQAITYPADLEQDRAMVADMLAGTRTHYHVEKRYRHGQGHTVWVLVSGSLVRDDAGRPLYFVSQISDVTDRKDTEVRLRESEHRLRALAQRLATTREDERRELSQLMHEGIAQDLFAMNLSLQCLRDRSGHQEEVGEACRELTAAVSRCMADVRQIANDLRPTALAHPRVAAALAEHAGYFGRIAGLTIKLTEDLSFPTLDEATGLLLFRAAQEALTNVARHAHAASVRIHLRATAAQVLMDIVDDGIGIDPAALAKPGSLGILGLRERFRTAGGGLEIRHADGARGTALTVFLPQSAP